MISTDVIMTITKSLKCAILTVATVCLMASCGGVNQSDPQSVADAALKMYQTGDYKGLISLINPDDTNAIRQCEQMQQIAEQMKDSGKFKDKSSYDYTFDKIVDGMVPTDKRVIYTYVDPDYEGGMKLDFTVNVTQIDGKWYFEHFN